MCYSVYPTAAALSAAWKKKENGFFVIDLRGMITEKLQLLKAADILMMDAFVDYLEADLIRTERSWVNEKSSEVLYVALQISRCKELVSLCNDAILRHPKAFISSKEFLFMPHDYVASLIERDILGLDEIDIFAAVIMWGINNTPGISLADDFSTWTTDNITTLQSNVIQLISQIRFFQMSPDDFMKKVGPLTRVFAPELYDQVVEYHANAQFQYIYDVQPLRLNSTIIKENEEPALISYWINHPDTDCDLPENLPFGTFDKIPFDFHLIFRCPGNELAQTAWRDLCYDQGPTMTIIRTKNQNEDEAVEMDSYLDTYGNNENYYFRDGVEVFIDFRHGEKLLAHANGFEDLEETIEELEVFRVVRKVSDEG
ncbi:17357_t:CDS:2 [Racocetra fulgida]|uniref:17357_t:CDS:1 n=1 Tax=Racocetra fulgida TaxID=60492 RepID=A0A9N8ZLZ7_9GLOM|nr:17357_t:CDS:2 [Racocetra fulgida]